MNENTDDGDEESTDDLWKEVEEFAETDPDDTEIEPFDEQPSGAEETPDADAVFDEVGVDEIEEAPDVDEVFDEVGVDEIDGEALWDELAGAEADAAAFDADEPTTVEAPTEVESSDEPPDSASQPDRQTTHVDSDPDGTDLVDKRSYCQQCPFFTAPPEVRCTHEGTEIVEVLEDGQFRVRNCPVVTDSGPDRTILNDGH